jgi:Protein of unknown function (DUF2480)
MEDIIVNKVAQSAIETIDLEIFYPKEDVVVFDLKDQLFMELILKEKEYREKLKNIDWSLYTCKVVAISCSTDAIIPLWAYMLATSYLQPVAKDVILGTREQVIEKIILKNIDAIDIKNYEGKKLVVKGCGDKEIPASAYAEITKLLRPIAQSIMYGEPCSTVPVYKKKN